VENVFDGICRIVSVDHCYWFLWEERYHRLSLAFAMLAGHPVSQWAEGREIYLSDELLQQIQAGQRERLNRTVRDTLAEWGLCPADVRYFNSFAIVVRGKIHGLFCAASSSLEDISPDEVQLISIIISQAASLYEQHAALSSATLVMTMSKVASEIAHDLRHPLTNIKGILQVLETKWYDSDFRQESFQLIHREIYRLTELTKELVRFANPNRFQAKYQDVHRILDRALDLVKNELSRGRIQLDTQYHQNLPPAYVDENEILETFLNLLLNSIESMPDGGVLTISTDLRQHLKDDSGTPRTFLQVSITDTGRGIAPEHRDHIFERYFTTKKNGTGLGLSIANRIVAAYHGFIEVHSVPDQGSTFSVHLPV
jgi:signal transduction histidine kinase